MRYLLVLFSIFAIQTAYADVQIKVVDQDNNPVSNAVISLLSAPMATAKTVAVMDQIDTSYEPRVLVIQKGQYVSFPNSDDIRHHVYSFSKPKSFELKLYKGSDIAPILFDKSGLVVLGCNIHDSMIGYIYVADNVFTVKTNEKGWATVPAKMGDDITIWDEYFVDGTQTIKHYKITNEEKQTIQLELLPPADIENDSYTYDYDS
ncbi:methylamine utilization protein [Marinomonas transparens]|uniref:Methylamine utilization protein n=1 Tax=Marinomonas transparens TaxID=2795388 RepID=A0A934N0Q8_9GAMM|nr:methylamine utilization protein [Marinomonas transparens]MBJ7538795.1 methylamine utilization protein [Marinomonas transparens]